MGCHESAEPKGRKTLDFMNDRASFRTAMKTKFSKSTLVALFAAMAATAFGLSSCSTSAGTGALIGGGTGAVVGGARGAAIGAGVGAVGGAIVDEVRH